MKFHQKGAKAGSKYKNALLFFGLALFLSPAGAEKKKIPAESVKSLLIKGIHLNLKVRDKKSSHYEIHWSGDLSLKNKAGVLMIQSPDFNSKKAWKAPPQKASVLEISGPSRPLQFFSHSSEISFSNWKKPVFISSFKGQIKSSNATGPWKLSLKEGSIELQKQKGPLSVLALHAKLQILSSQGDFQFHINEGQLKVKESEGHLNFTTDKAEVSLSKFKGSLRGSSQSGNVQVSIQPDTVDLFVKDSPLRVYLMGQSARLKAHTEKGKIYAPTYLYKQFSGKSTSVSGKVKGRYSKTGTVSLKTETGNIYIN